MGVAGGEDIPTAELLNGGPLLRLLPGLGKLLLLVLTASSNKLMLSCKKPERFQLASLTVDRLAHKIFLPNIKTHLRENCENLPGRHMKRETTHT